MSVLWLLLLAHDQKLCGVYNMLFLTILVHMNQDWFSIGKIMNWKTYEAKEAGFVFVRNLAPDKRAKKLILYPLNNYTTKSNRVKYEYITHFTVRLIVVGRAQVKMQHLS